MNIIKCGLFSENLEVAIWCARLLIKLGQEIVQIGDAMAGEAWDWFTDASKPMKHLVEPRKAGDEPFKEGM